MCYLDKAVLFYTAWSLKESETKQIFSERQLKTLESEYRFRVLFEVPINKEQTWSVWGQRLSWRVPSQGAEWPDIALPIRGPGQLSSHSPWSTGVDIEGFYFPQVHMSNKKLMTQ